MADFTFTPKSEEELSSLLEEGIYDYFVTKAVAKQSKSGNPMIALTLSIKDEMGDQVEIIDYLILMDNKFCQRKIRHFCLSAGLSKEYAKGALNSAECVRKKGKLRLGIQKDETGKYAPKNVVADYLSIDDDLKEAVNRLPSKRPASDLPPIEAYDDIPQ
jgi:hypothetical protein